MAKQQYLTWSADWSDRTSPTARLVQKDQSGVLWVPWTFWFPGHQMVSYPNPVMKYYSRHPGPTSVLIVCVCVCVCVCRGSYASEEMQSVYSASAVWVVSDYYFFLINFEAAQGRVLLPLFVLLGWWCCCNRKYNMTSLVDISRIIHLLGRERGTKKGRGDFLYPIYQPLRSGFKVNF